LITSPQSNWRQKTKSNTFEPHVQRGGWVAGQADQGMTKGQWQKSFASVNLIQACHENGLLHVASKVSLKLSTIVLLLKRTCIEAQSIGSPWNN
jgi:hypothetical protein